MMSYDLCYRLMKKESSDISSTSCLICKKSWNSSALSDLSNTFYSRPEINHVTIRHDAILRATHSIESTWEGQVSITWAAVCGFGHSLSSSSYIIMRRTIPQTPGKIYTTAVILCEDEFVFKSFRRHNRTSLLVPWVFCTYVSAELDFQYIACELFGIYAPPNSYMLHTSPSFESSKVRYKFSHIQCHAAIPSTADNPNAVKRQRQNRANNLNRSDDLGCCCTKQSMQ